MLAVAARLELDGRRLDRERAAVGHRVARVHGEVEDHLLELPRVGLDRAGSGVEVHDERDVLADQAVEHLLDVGDDLVQVELAGLNHLLAAEREELLRERRGPGSGVLDLFEVFAHVLGTASRPSRAAVRARCTRR